MTGVDANTEREDNQSRNTVESDLKQMNMDEVTENLMSQAILKRREWSRKFNISDSGIFDLFSEFSSMIMISKSKGLDVTDKPPKPSKTDKQQKVFSVTYDAKLSNLLKCKSQAKEQSLDYSDLDDFRVPVAVFKEYSVVMKSLNHECQEIFLNALGIDTKYGKAKISWESFIRIYCLLKLDVASDQEFREFLVKVFDPHNNGLVQKHKFEDTLFHLFKGQFKFIDQDPNDKGMSVDILRGLVETGVTNEAGDLVMSRFKQALENGTVDLNIFKESLK